jgi:hypothetical protein
MTAKDKAEELINKFILHTERYNDGWIESDFNAAKKLANITVKEVLKVAFYANDEIYNFYLEVKQELDKL